MNQLVLKKTLMIPIERNYVCIIVIKNHVFPSYELYT